MSKTTITGRTTAEWISDLVKARQAAEAERDEALAEVERLRAFITSELDGICLNGEDAMEAFDRRDRHRAALVARELRAIERIRKAQR